MAEEMVTKKEESKDFLEVVISDGIHSVMGKALDLARISSMSDRNLQQFSRAMKDHANTIITYIIKELQSKEYIK